MYLSGIVIPHQEGIVVNSDPGEQAFYDQQQEQFGDVVVTADEADAYDMQQEAFADDGVGFASARRLKRQMLADGRRLKITRPFAPSVIGVNNVIEDDDDDDGLGKFSLKRLFKPPRALRKFKLGRFLGRTAIPFVGGGLLGLAAKKGIGTLLGKRKSRSAGAPGFDPDGNYIAPPSTAPAPAETPQLDVVGRPAPFFPPMSQPSPIGPAAGGGTTASEDVAAQVQATNGGVEEAGMFGGLDPKMLMIAAGVGLAIFAFSRGGRRGRR